MFKLIVIALMLGLFLLFSIPYMLYLEKLKKTKPKLAALKAQKMVSKVLKSMIIVTGTKVEVRGLENIPKEGGVLFVSNHRGAFDIHAGFSYTPKLFGFIAKQEMKRYPLLSNWMLLANCLFLDRKNVKNGIKTIIQGIDMLKDGTSLWICPEGTRSKGESVLDLKEFHEGSFKMAEKSGCPIVPVALTGTAEMFEKQFPKIKKSKLIIEYGKAFYPNDLPENDRKRLGVYTRNIILNMLEKNV